MCSGIFKQACSFKNSNIERKLHLNYFGRSSSHGSKSSISKTAASIEIDIGCRASVCSNIYDKTIVLKTKRMFKWRKGFQLAYEINPFVNIFVVISRGTPWPVRCFPPRPVKCHRPRRSFRMSTNKVRVEFQRNSSTLRGQRKTHVSQYFKKI